MAEQPALPQVHGIRMRVTLLDSNGVPTPGSESIYVTDAFTRVGISPVYTDGTEIEERSASGVVCVNYRGNDTYKRNDIEIELCRPDPYLAAVLSGGATMTDGDRVGFKGPAIGEVSGNGVSIEVWTNRVDDGVNDADSPYGWWVYPRVKNLRLGDYNHEDGALLPTFSGQAYENENWYDGPLNDWVAASDRSVLYMPTNAVPAASVGWQTLTAS